MKQTFLLSTLAAVIGFLSLSSYSSGPAANGRGDNTGRRSAALTCAAAGCHGAASSDIKLSAAFIDKTSGQPVTAYIGGHTYEVSIEARNELNSNNKFGFQAVIVNSNNAQAGSVIASALSADYRLSTSAGIQIVEQRRTLTSASGDNVFQVAFDWTAPVSGTGPVTLWAIFNAVNGNGTDDAGDRCNTPFSTTIDEEAPASIGNGESARVAVSLYPNPVTDVVRIALASATPGNYSTVVYHLSGAQVFQGSWTAEELIKGINIPVNDWNSGLYMVRIVKDGSEEHGYASFVRQ